MRDDAAGLWCEYLLTGDIPSRNRLAEHYLPLVERIALGLARRLPECVDVGDLISDGTFGLLGAIEGYRPSRGTVFSTYASWRIRGAMLDGIRDRDEVPRLVRDCERRLRAAREAAAQRVGGEPDEEDIAAESGCSGDDWAALVREGTPITRVSLDCCVMEGDNDRDVRQVDTLADRRQRDPAEVVEARMDAEAALRGMDRTERAAVWLYCGEGLTLREAGSAVGVGESRMSQVCSAALGRVRETVGGAAV